MHFQNFNIYKRLFLDLVHLPDTDGPDSYRMWADLRNFLLQLVNQRELLRRCELLDDVLLRPHTSPLFVMFFRATTCPGLPTPTLPLTRTLSRCCSSPTTTPRDPPPKEWSSWLVKRDRNRQIIDLFSSNLITFKSSSASYFQVNIAAKLSVSLLRHTELVPADRAFYEAGLACKVSPSEDRKSVLLLLYEFKRTFCVEPSGII